MTALSHRVTITRAVYHARSEARSPGYRATHEPGPSIGTVTTRIAGKALRPNQGRNAMNEITETLDAIDRGEPFAVSELLPLVYDDLRKIAAQKLAQEKPGQTLDPTALVHEAYLRLVAGGKDGDP